MGKALNCCTQFWRWLFVVLNVIFFLIGLAMISVGIWLLVSDQDFDFITDTIYASPAALLIVAGVVTVVISLVGILGAIGMWYIVLIVYISILVLVVILEIVAGILGAVFQDDLTNIAEERVLDAISDYRLNSSSEGFKSDVNNFIDFLQEEFECCGYSATDNWINTIFYNESGMFPESCECDVEDCARCAPFRMFCNDSQAMDPTMQFIWTQACNSSFIDRLEENLGVIAGVGTAFGVFEISGVAVALGLCICACMRKKDKDDFPIDEYVY